LSDEHWKHATTYTAQVFGNLVNYKSFGFSKFIPRIKESQFKSIVAASPNSVDALARWEKVRAHIENLPHAHIRLQLAHHIYNVEPEPAMLIGDPNKGHVTNYYFGGLTTEEEVVAIQKTAEREKIDVLNTRVEKHGPDDFTLHVASVDERERDVTFGPEGEESKCKLKIKWGDFKDDLQRVVDGLGKALEYAANEHQKAALEKYIKSWAPHFVCVEPSLIHNSDFRRGTSKHTKKAPGTG